jgi:hypothetical protein
MPGAHSVRPGPSASPIAARSAEWSFPSRAGVMPSGGRVSVLVIPAGGIGRVSPDGVPRRIGILCRPRRAARPINARPPASQCPADAPTGPSPCCRRGCHYDNATGGGSFCRGRPLTVGQRDLMDSHAGPKRQLARRRQCPTGPGGGLEEPAFLCENRRPTPGKRPGTSWGLAGGHPSDLGQ